MPTRPIATGTVAFGLVAIPIKLYSTNEGGAKVSLNFLHETCGTRVKYQYYCPTDDEVVTRDDLVKGYEFAKGQYAVFTEDELKGMEAKTTHSIEITEFVPAVEVDPIHYERTYYLGPDKGGEKPYRLLAEAMKETGRSALAKYAARGKDYLVLVRPFKEGLVMQQLRYNDEIKAFAEVPIGTTSEIEESELKLATRLIDQISTDAFDPEKYEDDVKTRLLQAIAKKVEGQEITAAPKEEPKAQIIDLMDALKASLAEGGTTKKAAKAKRGAKAKGGAKAKAVARKPPKRSPRKKKAAKKLRAVASGKKRAKAAK